MRHNKLTKLGLAAAICAMTAAPGLAMAQAANQDPAQAQDQYHAPGDAGDVSDEKLRSYVKATGKLYQIDTEWQPKLQGATDQERAAMEREIQTRMVAVVEQEGLSVNEYNEIARAVQSDPELQEKAQGLMQQEQQRP